MTTSLHALIAQMASDVKELKEDKRAAMMEMASNKAIISQQEKEMNSLREDNVKLQKQLSLFRAAANNAEFTPPPQRKRKNHTCTSVERIGNSG